jgi:hypothetical protein
VRLGETTVTSARKSSSFFTFLLAVLVAGGLIALVGLQGLPWLQKPDAQASKEPAPETAPPPSQEAPKAEAPKTEVPKAEAPATEPPKETPKEEPKETAPVEPPKVERKPSPMGPPELIQRPAPPPALAVQAVTIITSPAGASAMLDNRVDAVCQQTPCTLDAATGRHVISIKLAGYLPETREFIVGSGPLELPIVVLHAPTGTLMLTSNPSGATVSVNGRQTGKTTPAQLALTPGSYKITVERDGRQSTQNVEVHGGISYLRITFGQ